MASLLPLFLKFIFLSALCRRSRDQYPCECAFLKTLSLQLKERYWGLLGLAVVLSYNVIFLSVSWKFLCTLSGRYVGLGGCHGDKVLVFGLRYIVLCFIVTAVCYRLLPVISNQGIFFS